MLKANAPIQLTQIWAAGSGAGPVNAVPLTPYTGQPAGQAAYSTGFATVNVTPIGSGGIPPWGADFNGVMQNQTTAQIWEQAGYIYPYSSAFATNANIGGYPAGALLGSATSGFSGFWLSTADSNTTNPDSSGSANWLELRANGGVSSIALSGAMVTPTENQLGAPLLLLTGTLTANCQLVLPLRAGAKWTVQNNTTGSFTVTVGGSSGTAVTISQGASNLQEVTTDGTNYYVPSISGGPYLPLTGTAVAATQLAAARTIAMTGQVTWSVSFDGSANVSAAGTIGAGQVTLANLANETGNTLLGNPTSSAAAPSAITLTNGLVFAGTALGLGSIVVTGMTSSGNVSITGTATTSAGFYCGGMILAGTTSGAGTGASALLFTSSVYMQYVISSGAWSLQGGSSFAVPTLSVAGAATSTNGFTCGGMTLAGTTSGAGTGASVLLFTSSVYMQYNISTSAWSFQGGSSLSTPALSVNGTISSTGTANFNTSDETLKKLIPAEPRPLHRNGSWFAYERIDTGELGRGPTAQAMATVAPDYVREYDHPMPNGSTLRKLQMATPQVALETAFWAAHRVDDHERRLVALEARV